MRDLRVADSPIRVGLVRYAMLLATFHVASSLVIVSVYVSVLGARVLEAPVALSYLDFLARAELLCLFASTFPANARFLTLTRSGLPVTSKMLADCMLRALTECAVVALAASAAWCAAKLYIGPVWWHAALASFGGYILARSVLRAALAFEPPMPLEQGNVLSMRQARNHL